MDLQKIIDNWIFKKETEEQETRDVDCWSASSMGLCPKMRFWQRQGKKSTIAEPMVYARQRLVGKFLHALLNRILADENLLVSGEEELQLGSLKGHYDALIKDEDGKYILLDHKTVHSKNLDWILREGVDEHRKMQVATYAYLLKKLKPEIFKKIKSFQLGFLSRDDCRIFTVAQELTPLLEKKIEDEIAYLDKCWAEQKEPENCPPEPWMCKRCMYRNQCKDSKVSLKTSQPKLTTVINL